MAFEKLGELNRPCIVIWPLPSREAAWQKLPTLLLDGDA